LHSINVLNVYLLVVGIVTIFAEMIDELLSIVLFYIISEQPQLALSFISSFVVGAVAITRFLMKSHRK